MMRKYLLIVTATCVYAAASAQVFVNSYDSSRVPPNGIFGRDNKINATIVPPIDTSNKIIESPINLPKLNRLIYHLFYRHQKRHMELISFIG